MWNKINDIEKYDGLYLSPFIKDKPTSKQSVSNADINLILMCITYMLNFPVFKYIRTAKELSPYFCIK